MIDNALAAGNAFPDEFIERAEQHELEKNSDIQGLFDEFEIYGGDGLDSEGVGGLNLTEIADFQNGFAFYTTDC